MISCKTLSFFVLASIDEKQSGILFCLDRYLFKISNEIIVIKKCAINVQREKLIIWVSGPFLSNNYFIKKNTKKLKHATAFMSNFTLSDTHLTNHPTLTGGDVLHFTKAQLYSRNFIKTLFDLLKTFKPSSTQRLFTLSHFKASLDNDYN